VAMISCWRGSRCDKVKLMKIQRVSAFALALFGISVSTAAQTARDYFDELKAANTFNHYKDIYACFPEDDPAPSFAVIAPVSEVMKAMEHGGDKDGAKLLAQAKGGLLVQTYYKGVGSEEYHYEGVKRPTEDENKQYEIEFGSPTPGKMVYSINWATRRYLLVVYIFQKSKVFPTTEVGGKCELIHPGT
jgi:hypothetical protein